MWTPYCKDICDRLAALMNAKVINLVNSGFSIDNPKCFAEAIVKEAGVPNTIVMIGPVIGEQKPIPPKLKCVDTISKMHQFVFSDESVHIRRVAQIGSGYKNTKIKPLDVTTEFRYKIENPHQLENGLPKGKTSQPVETFAENFSSLSIYYSSV